MTVKWNLLSSVLFIFLLVGTIQAQQYDTTVYYNPLTDNIATKLPPLEALIDSAIANSPLVRIEELQADYNRYEIKSAQRDWMRNIYLDLEFNAGDWNYWDRDEQFDMGNQFYFSESQRLNYLAGVSVRFPLKDLVDRKNQIAMEKKQTEIALVRRQQRIREVRELVITTYNELIQQQNLLRISNEYQQYADIYMPIAEMEFKNGQIPASELQRLKDYQTRGELAFADIVKAFNDAYWRLEEIVGMKFNLINVQR